MTILINSTQFYSPGSLLVAGQVYQVVDIPGKPTYKYMGMFRWSKINPNAPVPAPYVPNTTAPILATINPDTGDVTLKTTEGTTISTSGAGGVQVPADWNASSGVARILNKPTIPSQYTDEMAQDAAALALVSGTHVGATVTYDDASNKINITVTGGGGGGGASVPTDLTVSNRTATTLDVVSNTGTDATLPAATATQAGLMSAADKTLLGAHDTAIAGKQATLVSGVNIKTVNGTSILGSGDLVVAGSGGGVSRVSRKLTSVVNTKTVTVNAVGLGTQADLDAATLAASVDGTSSMVLTLSGLGSVKLSSLSVDVPAGANGGTGFTLVAPDPMGATTLADSSLALMAIYNDAGAVVASTLVTLALSSGNLSVSKSGLTAGSAYRFKVIY